MDGVAAWREVTTDLFPLNSGIPEELESDNFRLWHGDMLSEYKVEKVQMNFSVSSTFLLTAFNQERNSKLQSIG